MNTASPAPRGHRKALLLRGLLLAWLLLGPPIPRSHALEAVTRISLTQQFIVTGIPLQPMQGIQHDLDREYLVLEPATAVVSCERIKEMLLRELKLPDEWKGKIHLRLHPRPLDSEDEATHLTMVPNPEGWLYYLDAPDRLSRRRFITSMVLVLLQELCNRGAKETPGEYPPWLGDGLAAHLESLGIGELMVDPFSGGTRLRRHDGFQSALRERLRRTPSLTLDQLSFPTPGMDPIQRSHYRDCAHLLTTELLHLERGPARMAQMLRHSPAHLNWQTGFLDAFQPEFKRMADVEKWWAVSVAHFIGMEKPNELTLPESLAQLREILVVPVQVRNAATGVTNRSLVDLQKAISEWDPDQLDPILQKRINQLQALQWRVGTRVTGLVAQYQNTLSGYLAERKTVGTSTSHRAQPGANTKILIRKTLRQLTELDRTRARIEAEEAALEESRRPRPPRAIPAGGGSPAP
ncbi:MAG TPA: hypothetical protein DCM86_04280 [Verrucomicrobiales bacterium]|nr:hypothetical protein [Verrucomicrobiales bacterium]